MAYSYLWTRLYHLCGQEGSEVTEDPLSDDDDDEPESNVNCCDALFIREQEPESDEEKNRVIQWPQGQKDIWERKGVWMLVPKKGDVEPDFLETQENELL